MNVFILKKRMPDTNVFEVAGVYARKESAEYFGNDLPKECEWCIEEMPLIGYENEIQIPCSSGKILAASANEDDDYKEIFVYLKDADGIVTQDLCIVGEDYDYDNNSHVIAKPAEYTVKVYAKEWDEGWTHRFDINEYIPEEQEEDNKPHEMELGNLLFGNSRGEYPLQPREAFQQVYVDEILEKTSIDSYGMVEPSMLPDKDCATYDCELFTIRPYYWGDDEDEAEKPNFVYKPTGLELQWYKYPFRDSYSNQEITPEQLREIFRECAAYYNAACRKEGEQE